MSEKDYNALVDMFVSDGWKIYMEHIEKQEEGATKGAVDAADTSDKWQYLRGLTHQMRATIAFETFVRLSYEAQQEEDEDADL